MCYHPHIEKMVGPSDLSEKIEAVRFLAPFANDPQIMDALCETAITTTSHRLREHLIEVLKSNPAGACMRFMDEALWSAIPSRRQWALVNLSLLDCREAKEAVIRGLNDTCAAVRKAAAMSAGLYGDADVLSALERYFENHRLELTLSFIGTGFESLRKKKDPPDDRDGSKRSVGYANLHFQPLKDR